MPYVEGDLTPNDTTSEAWALAWLRFYLRDTDDDAEVYTDTELTAWLEATAQVLPVNADAADQDTYYRPHQAAADIISGDPDRKIMERILSWQGEYRPAEQVARGILAAGAWIDALIHDAADVYPDRGGTLEAVF